MRYIDLDPRTIPDNCHQIIITQNKTKIVIKNESSQVNSSVSNKHKLIMRKVRDFFGIEAHFLKLKPILMQESPISLRLLDWSTTNWSRKHTIMLDTKRHGYPERINMFLDYKAHLKAFSKRSFDPFCRRERIIMTFECDPEKKMYVSTTAQMNFFKWAIESGVLDYCEAHVDDIENDMVQCLRVKTHVDPKENISKVVTATMGKVSISM